MMEKDDTILDTKILHRFHESQKKEDWAEVSCHGQVEAKSKNSPQN